MLYGLYGPRVIVYFRAKLSQLGEDIDKKLEVAEAKVNEFKEIFEQFQLETNEKQAKYNCQIYYVYTVKSIT